MCLEISINTVPTMVHNVAVCALRTLCVAHIALAFPCYCWYLVMVGSAEDASRTRLQSVIPSQYLAIKSSSRARFVSKIFRLISFQSLRN